ncbi:BlaI/MecI/CopY family transcriptional regulator [Streptococcus pluranimalium]|uniref:BlaI/MecI/CopY family transcriptional regulator n=1 Tax=Streptococcus pluranimalium TaxID=82348 RepID=UPI0039FC7322
MVTTNHNSGLSFTNREFTVSNSELVILRMIWTLGERTALQLFTDLSSTYCWSLSTIKTFLARLEVKELISHRKLGRQFIYHSIVSEQEILDCLIADFLSKVCSERHGELMTTMLDIIELTEDKKRDILSILQEKSTVLSVTCNCVEKSKDCDC